jgi:hypothetical protein
MWQTSLLAMTLGLYLNRPHDELQSYAWWVAVFTLVGAMMGGWFGHFKTGAAIGFLHSFLMGLLVLRFIPVAWGT